MRPSIQDRRIRAIRKDFFFHLGGICLYKKRKVTRNLLEINDRMTTRIHSYSTFRTRVEEIPLKYPLLADSKDDDEKKDNHTSDLSPARV